MTCRVQLFFAGISGLLAVALGAFGAHALKARLAPELYAAYQTGVEYQFYHTLALLLVVVMRQQHDLLPLRWSAWTFIAGILLFCGSLYVLALSGVGALGMITPLGGLLLLCGWGCLVVAAYFYTRGDD
ncbi:DUF423 domain-containing protein [Pontibacter sp. JAM-7]|uniref:DUF423 domain-containing protein n=1 Tax=Pontibacter sp. JAM-7 TaxID=3366581 RepID=UPI003AF6E796